MSEQTEKIYEWYCSTRKWYNDIAGNEIVRFERATLVASGGSLAAASTLFQTSTPTSVSGLISISLGVMSLGASFLSVLLSNYLAYKDNRARVQELDDRWEDADYKFVDSTRASRVVERMNFSAIAFLAAGFVFVIVFGIISAVAKSLTLNEGH